MLVNFLKIIQLAKFHRKIQIQPVKNRYFAILTRQSSCRLVHNNDSAVFLKHWFFMEIPHFSKDKFSKFDGGIPLIEFRLSLFTEKSSLLKSAKLSFVFGFIRLFLSEGKIFF